VDVGVIKRKLKDTESPLSTTDQQDGAAENGREPEHLQEDHETLPLREGYKRTCVCIDPTTSKDEITQVILHQIKQTSG